ncbi:MAG: hypothetical protein A3C30_02875 [Candidatus Levybacteria bacterium RIFCSPHIGHO2_02_FULL_40_18]|nr:MAG: hypothetical protein A2869_05105 [Candidatus Levybacteria bacterium RIFCSPHIGHO2_01_FULL_40_58]OGH26919.1 MAG: hypothetical protein A3C30_02875 [Candidatus Levybacteria bacterium RIFCSPHIGHO2_02_FULL_40_18]OGH32041.1 MAG: hypothetical protein A3E43_03855 [Candidatus Levybacteria bacterium RIFCSPHIGHO2_12_FULL_40_31]OGH40837.1 MAG: hypothetical protein A2894_04545 [Candidatus Levybacteria bacterium RIFCSPLOWO2_01_FULL_40_64]OGH48693.1 MAG: hypothetical protein A3I54_03475 [Candidatus Lev
MLKKEWAISTFIIAVFLLRIPPLYFTGIKNIFLTTHSIVVLTIPLIFLYLFSQRLYYKKRLPYLNTPEALFVVIFFATQSLSIFGASNVEIFLQRYVKIIFGIIVFIAVKELVAIDKKIIYKVPIAIIAGGLITFGLQLILFFAPDVYFQLGETLIYKNVYSITITNFSVGKIFDDSFLQTVTPFIIYYLASSKNKLIIPVLVSAMVGMGMVDFASNFRYRVIAYVVSLASSLGLIFRFKRNLIIVIGIVFLIFLVLPNVDKYLRQNVGFSFVDRILLESETRDIASIEWRLSAFEQSIQMASTNIFGVGLGNFFDKSQFVNIPKTNFPNYTITIEALKAGPHNIFFQILAETGLPGLTSLVILLAYFVRKDLHIIKDKMSGIKTAYVLGFWTLILIGQFFPTNNFTFFTLFFLFRGAL